MKESNVDVLNESRYILAAELPHEESKKCEKAVATLCSRLGIRPPGSIGPHITLKTPFSVTDVRLRRQRDAVRTLIHDMVKVPLKSVQSFIGGLGTFSAGERKIVHLTLPEDQNKELYGLARKFVDGFASFGVPPVANDAKNLHITLARNVFERELGGVMEELSNVQLPKGRMPIGALMLYEKVGMGSWRHSERFPLQ